jgi:NAD(P)H-dependent flavin oxidoreductase YrpB (nitropropane dioxygenase family)
MSRLVTPLMQYLPALRTPIVLGPMANAAGGLLCGAVSRAGAFGYIEYRLAQTPKSADRA